LGIFEIAEDTGVSGAKIDTNRFLVLMNSMIAHIAFISDAGRIGDIAAAIGAGLNAIATADT